MSVLAGPLFALAAVVAAAGVLKLARPASAVAALRTAGLPHDEVLVRLLGAAEIVLAAAVLALGGRLPALLLAAAYAGFAGFAAVLMVRSDRAASCGCFGVASSAPTTPLHVGVNVVAALVGLAAMVWPVAGIADVVAAQPAFGVPFLLLTGAAAWLVVATLTTVPELLAAAALVRGDSAAEAARDDDDQSAGPVTLALGATRR